MALDEKISKFCKEEYDLLDIKTKPIVKSIENFDNGFSYSKFHNSREFSKYVQIYNLLKKEFNCIEKDLGVLFLRYNEFPFFNYLISFVKENSKSERPINLFFTALAKKEYQVYNKIFRQKGVVDNIHAKNFLKKALEHKLICEDPDLWEEPDDDIAHLKFLCIVSNKLFYLEKDLEKKISLQEFNYKHLLKKGDKNRKEYDDGFNYVRRLFESTSSLSVCYFRKKDVNKAKEYLDLSMKYFNKMLEFDIGDLDENISYSISKNIGRFVSNLDKYNDYCDTKFIETLKIFEKKVNDFTYSESSLIVS